VSSGASGDIQAVSAVARAMVMRWGMSEKIGNIDYSEAHEGYQGNAGGFSVSAETKRMIEDEVKTIIDEGYARATKVLDDHEEEFERLAKGLLEYETLTGDEIRKVLAGEPLGGDDNADKPSSGGGTASVAAIPKTKPRKPKPGAEPEPAPL
jgi:cell division protease FtsH